MTQYVIRAKVRKIIIEDVTMKVNANHLNMAMTKARDVIESYPECSTPGVPFYFVSHRETYDTDILNMDEETSRA